jgi:hypothetical protein
MQYGKHTNTIVSALQASLQATSLSAKERLSADARSGSGGGLQLAVVSIATPGLQNNQGEYNCFLNCILQCLWNCQEFKPTIQNWQPHQIQVGIVSCIMPSPHLPSRHFPPSFLLKLIVDSLFTVIPFISGLPKLNNSAVKRIIMQFSQH